MEYDGVLSTEMRHARQVLGQSETDACGECNKNLSSLSYFMLNCPISTGEHNDNEAADRIIAKIAFCLDSEPEFAFSTIVGCSAIYIVTVVI